MNDLHDEELLRRLERLGQLQPQHETTRRAVERVRCDLVQKTNPPSRVRRRLASICGAALAAGLLVALMLHGPSQGVGFAQVQAAMKSARSVTFKETTLIKGKPTTTTRHFVLDNGSRRAEEDDGSYSVADPAKHRELLVDTKKRAATLFLSWNVPKLNVYEFIKNLPADASARPLPGKKIGGKDALGFVVKVEGNDLIVWADPRTRLPVRLEVVYKGDEGTSEEICDEFVFDKELDAKLFSFEPPEGYKLETKGVAEFPDSPSDTKLKDLVVTPLVGIGPVKFGMTREEVEKLLGKPDGTEPIGKRGSVNMHYGSRGFFILASKDLGVAQIYCTGQEGQALRVREFSGKTDKGIALGASAADIIRAYGEPNTNETKHGSNYLVYNKLQAHFTLFKDKLNSMMFLKPPRKK